MTDDNQIVIEAWNTVLFDKFVRFKHVLVDSLGRHGQEALKRHPPRPGARVLDVGCGFGDTTRLLAEQVGPSGSAVGVDCAENFIHAATKEAADSGASNVEFFAADVQTDDLRGPYDHAFSRFGTMFFMLPGAALRNIRRALAPGGKLTMIVWRRREDNGWIHEAEQLVKGLVPVVSHEETDQVHCGPGPFSMAGADLVSDLLQAAGFDQVSFERYDADLKIGRDLDEAVELAMAIGPAGEIIRLAGEEGEKKKPEVTAALRELLSAGVRDDGVWGRSSTWFISAQNPRG